LLVYFGAKVRAFAQKCVSCVQFFATKQNSFLYWLLKSSNMPSNFVSLHELLEQKVQRFNHPNFIINDPISIAPHRFSKLQDVEISAFLGVDVGVGLAKNHYQQSQRVVWFDGQCPPRFYITPKACTSGGKRLI
jgi:hypothetical protein